MRLIIITVFVLVSCEDRFTFDTKLNQPNQIVVSGIINQGPGPYLITIRTITKKSTDETAVEFAIVKIFDDAGNEEDCPEVSAGIYRCEGLIVKGEPGRSYHTEIDLGNNRVFRSSPDRMPTVKGDSFKVSWEETTKTTTSANGVDVSAKIVQLSLSAKLPNTNEPYQMYWRVEELYQFLQKQIIYPFQPPPPCYVVNDVSERVDFFNSRGNVSLNYSIDNMVQRGIDDSFLRKHIFSSYQMSISEEYLNYLQKIGELTENVGSIFDTPKGIIAGNMISVTNAENIHGFFRAVQIDTVHFAIYPNDLITKPRDRCIVRPDLNCFGCIKGNFDRPALFDLVN